MEIQAGEGEEEEGDGGEVVGIGGEGEEGAVGGAEEEEVGDIITIVAGMGGGKGMVVGGRKGNTVMMEAVITTTEIEITIDVNPCKLDMHAFSFSRSGKISNIMNYYCYQLIFIFANP